MMPPGTAAASDRRRHTAKTLANPANALHARAAGGRASRTGSVRRPALIHGLAGAREAALTVLVAPAGYGKSTVLSEWAENDERPFFWLDLDARATNSVDMTVRSIVDLFEAAGWVEPMKLPAPGSTVKRGAPDALISLMRSLRAQSRSFVLVVDDAHLIAPAVLREVVGTAIKELPHGSMIALASRREPALPLGRLRASRALAEVRVPDLVMTPAEARVLLRRAGLELDFEAVQMVVRRTEGWPAGLYLAALSLRERVDIHGALIGFGGDDHRLADYFRDEVLSALPSDLLTFSIRTAVLDELSGPACDAVLNQHDSALMLIKLAKTTPLLLPLDPAHDRYRWHGLFRDALRAELRHAEPELESTLHRRASHWHRSHGDMDRATAHAVSAHDVVLVGDLVWANIVAYITQGRNEIVQDWLSSFSHEELADYAPLALSAAFSFVAAGRADRGQHWATTAIAALEREADGRVPSLTAGLATLEAMFARAGAHGMADAAARACEPEPADSPWRPICLFLRGTAHHLMGDRAAARQLLEQASDLSAAPAPSVMSLCLAQGAMIAIEQKDWDTAAALTDRAAAVIEERELAGNPMSALVFAALAASRAHDGRGDEAKRDLRSAINLLTDLGDFIPWYGAEARILLAHASLWLADVVGARTLLAEASRLARRTPGAIIFQQWFDEAWAYMDTLAETSLAGPSSLTIAELRVLRFLPSHHSFREIAGQLGVSANTIKTQAHAVYRKLGVASRSEAVARASDAGLLGR